MLQVKSKRRQIRALEKRPGELVEFVLENPILVVLGPADRRYVIDRHHLALALTRENFETVPMRIEADFSRLTIKPFWKRMQARKFVHPINARGRRKPISDLPKDLDDLVDDPYRSLAGFVREAGKYRKRPAPYVEFVWADFYRKHISKKLVRDDFDKALAKAKRLSTSKAAARLPGYIGPKSG
jgi:hypothetical protein